MKMETEGKNHFAISATKVKKKYQDVVAVDDLTINIESGSFTGLLGPNGSGKTTTIHMLATLLRPTRGEIFIQGQNTNHGINQIRRQLGLVFQDSALDRTLSIRQNLRFAGLLQNMSTNAIKERTDTLLEIFDLSKHTNRPVGSLSGGMRRAVDICRGVLHDPAILFLDEPTIGLDLTNRMSIWRFIDRLRKYTGMTVLLTTHYLEEAKNCDIVNFICGGKIISSGNPDDLIEQIAEYIIEIESEQMDLIVDRLVQSIGPVVKDGNTGYFRYCGNNVSELSELQRKLEKNITTWRIRKPNLNDVFMWLTKKESN